MITQQQQPFHSAAAIVAAIVVLIVTDSAVASYRTHRLNATATGQYYRHNGYDGNATNAGNWTRGDGQTSNAYSAAIDTYLGSASVLYGMIGQSTPTVVTAACHSHLQATYAAVHRRDVWAMKILDASATAQPGFVWGNNHWFGSRQQCESVQVKKQITLSPRFERNMKPSLVDDRAPFDVGYRMVYARHSSPWQLEVEFLISSRILHLGVCVPMSCTNRDIHLLSQSYLDSGLMEAQNLLVHQANVVHVKDMQLSAEFYDKMSLKIVGGFLLFTCVMVVVATMYEPRERASASKTDRQQSSASSSTPPPPLPSPTSHKPSAIDRFVGCFSLRSNVHSLLCTDSPPNALPTINAFKSIGCFLILNFHLLWYSFYAISNGSEAFVMGEQIQWQWLATTPVIVDIFFSISGLLLAYNFLRNEQRISTIRTNSLWANVCLFAKQFLHRYLRLTPLYLAVVGGTEIATAYLAEKSPFWMNDRNDLRCQQHWWRNVLYVQNFYDVEEACLNWTWSLACEMQFFVVFSALLFAYAKYPERVRRIYVALLGGFVAVLVVISWRLKFTPAYDVLHDLGSELYTAPWVRVLPYQIGVGVGWYLHRSAGEPLPWSTKTVNLVWTASTTLMVVCHFATILRNCSHLVGVPLIVAVRLLYGGAACWMIVASVKGHGGWFSRAMNLPVFVHLNRLSYGIYLLNPIVVSLVYGLADSSASIEPVMQITTGVGVMVIVYMMSFVCSLLFEVPYMRLSAEILRASKPKTL